MWTYFGNRGGWAVLIVPTLLGLAVFAQEPQGGTRTAAVNLDDLQPRWQPGDTWIVETSSRLLQAREAIRNPAAGRSNGNFPYSASRKWSVTTATASRSAAWRKARHNP